MATDFARRWLSSRPVNTGERVDTLFARGLAIAGAIAYLALLGFGWALNAPAGFDGILRPQPHEIAAGQPSLVREVEPGSPADQAGVRAGDVVVSVDGNPMVFDIHQTYHNRRAATPATLRVMSPGQESRVVPLVLESRLASPSIVLNLALAALLGIAIVAVGACVAWVRPDSLPARLLLAFAFALAVSTPSDLWHWTQRTATSATLLDQVSGIIALFGAVALLHFFLIFPAPGALYARFGRAIGPLYITSLLVVPLSMLLGGAGLAAITSGLLFAALLICAPLALELSYRNPATPLARAQLGWVRWGLAVGVGVKVADGIARVLVPDGVPAWLVFPVSVAFAVLRYRLFEVDRVVRASITWGILAGLLLGAYLVLVVVAGRLVASVLGPSIGAAGDPTVAIVAVLVTAALAHPLRARLHAALDRYVYRQRFLRARVLEQASELLSQPQPPDAIARFLCRQVPQSLALSGGWLAVPAEESHAFEVDAGILLPNVSLASPSLVEVTRGADGPLLIAPPEDLPAYASMPNISAETAGTQPWYLTGARLLVPLRAGSGSLLGLWLLGVPTSGDLFDRADLAAFGRLAMLAEMQLERRRARPGAAVAREVPVGGEALTQREQEVFALLGRGLSNREIAEELVISVRTAETHVERILHKLGVDNRAQAMLLARQKLAKLSS